MPEVDMPRLSDTMQEGTIARWLKKPGEQVQKGDVLAEIETDKATMDLEAYDAGVLERIIVPEGESAAIGQPIAIIGTGSGGAASQEERADGGAAPPAASGKSSPAAAVQPERSSTEQPSALPPGPPQERVGEAAPAAESVEGRENGDRQLVKASPLARRMAEEHHIDLRQVRGSGPGGRIVRDDIEDFVAKREAAPQEAPAAPTPAAPPSATTAPAAASPTPQQGAQAEDVEIVTLSRMQATVARRLTEAKQTIPHFYVSSEIDMTDALALRQTFNESAGEDGVKVSVNDLIIKACALALEKFPEVNSSYKDGQFLRHKHIHVGFAVDVPAGLVVPVIHDANSKGLRTIAREARALIEKARANKLTPAEMTGSTFSISNLGMMDVTNFVAVINPPEAAILAVATTRKRFVPVDEQPVVRDIMPVTLSADHRVIYGATVARFLQEVKRLLQSPFNLLG